MSGDLALFAASIHFRYIHYVMDVKGADAPAALADLRSLLRRVCLDGVVPAEGLHLYLEFEPDTDDPALGFPPGLNAYLSTSIDGRLFDWHPPGARVEWVSFVKLPSMLLFCSLVPIFGNAADAPIPTQIRTAGTLDSENQGRAGLHLMREETLEHIWGIQESYEHFPARQHARNAAKIQGPRTLSITAPTKPTWPTSGSTRTGSRCVRRQPPAAKVPWPTPLQLAPTPLPELAPRTHDPRTKPL